MDLITAKVDAAAASKKSGKKVYIIVDEEGECSLNNAPLKGAITSYLNGSEVELDNITSKVEAPTPIKKEQKVKEQKMEKVKEVKKVAAKKSAPAKKVAAKAPAKKVAKKVEGKKVDISIKDMRAKMKKGFIYRDPQGVRQSEAYLAGRSNQDYVREGMIEVAPQ